MLRTRLLLNLLPFLIIQLAMAFFAIWLVQSIARETRQLPFHAYALSARAQRMEEMVAGLEVAMALAGRGERAAAQALWSSNRSRLQMVLDQYPAAAQGFTNPAVSLAAQRTEHAANAFLAAGDQFLSGATAAGVGTLEPLTALAKALVVSIKELQGEHDQAWQRALERVERRRELSLHFMLAALFLIFICSGYACYLLGRSIFGPINLLTQATREVGRGNLDQVVPVVEHTELAELAQAFNQMAAQLRDYRQNTTHQITRLHQTMETTLATFPDPIFVFNKKNEIELKNPSAESFLKELKLEGLLPVMLHDTVKQVLETGESFLPTSFKDVLFFRISQQERYYLPRVLAMRNVDGLILGVAIVLLDVTRFRLMDDVKSNLVATVSHELKTPLTSVRMVLHLMLEQTVGPITAKQEELLIAARNDAERLLRILNNLLDLTRFEEDLVDVNFEALSPEEIVRMSVEETRESVLGRGVTVVADVESNLPRVRVDRQRIGHVFTNLINNAIKHSPIGERIIIRARRGEDNGIYFHVIDRGPGIPEQYHSRIFDKFFRVPGQAKKGAGLGLSIAKEIVVAHGGEIGVKSKLGRGSDFYVFLPSGKEVNPPPDGPARPQPVSL